MVRRRNPAEPGYWGRRLLTQVDRVETAADQLRNEPATLPAVPATGDPGAAGSIDSLERKPGNPHIVLYTSTAGTSTSHTTTMPVSTQAMPDPAKPHVAKLPYV